MKSEALVALAPHRLEVRPIDVPAPGKGQVLVAVLHSCISPGTESRVLAGKQVNMPDFPVVPGYSASGIIEMPGPDSRWQKGDKVFLMGAPCAQFRVCWGAHQRHVVVADDSLAAIPAGVEMGAASSAKLVAIAEHGRRLAGIGHGEKVAVLGLGPIGFFSAMCAKQHGADVAVADLRESRCNLATQLDFRVLPVGESKSSGCFDVVVDATGASGAMSKAINLLRDKPWDNNEHAPTRLVIQGSYANAPLLPYDELFWKEAIVLIPRDNQRRDLEAVLEMMASKQLAAGDILENFGSPTQASEAYRALAEGECITGYFSWQ